MYHIILSICIYYAYIYYMVVQCHIASSLCVDPSTRCIAVTISSTLYDFTYIFLCLLS